MGTQAHTCSEKGSRLRKLYGVCDLAEMTARLCEQASSYCAHAVDIAPESANAAALRLRLLQRRCMTKHYA